jgi:hypothetical protein
MRPQQERECAVKTIVLFSTMIAASILFSVPGRAGGGAPAQLMPSQPYPSYCEPCFWPQPQAVIVRHPAGRHARAIHEKGSK